MRQLGVQMHGVTLNLQCNYDKLLDHTADLLDGHTCPPWASPDLAVTGALAAPTVARRAGTVGRNRRAGRLW